MTCINLKLCVLSLLRVQAHSYTTFQISKKNMSSTDVSNVADDPMLNEGVEAPKSSKSAKTTKTTKSKTKTTKGSKKKATKRKADVDDSGDVDEKPANGGAGSNEGSADSGSDKPKKAKRSKTDSRDKKKLSKKVAKAADAPVPPVDKGSAETAVVGNINQSSNCIRSIGAEFGVTCRYSKDVFPCVNRYVQDFIVDQWLTGAANAAANGRVTIQLDDITTFKDVRAQSPQSSSGEEDKKDDGDEGEGKKNLNKMFNNKAVFTILKGIEHEGGKKYQKSPDAFERLLTNTRVFVGSLLEFSDAIASVNKKAVDGKDEDGEDKKVPGSTMFAKHVDVAFSIMTETKTRF